MEIKNSTFTLSNLKEMPMSIFFVRHAEADRSGKESDPDLTELGVRQAERVARRLSDFEFDHVYASSMKRALKTAKMIHVYHKSVPFTVTDDLREVALYHFIPNAGPYDRTMRESVREEKDGITRFINRLRHDHSSGERILVVCHGNIIRTMVPMVGGREPTQSILMEINNTALTIMNTWPSGEAVLMLANCVKHLVSRQIT